MTTVEPLDNHPDDIANWSCFGQIMSSKEYLEKHHITYKADCRTCDFQKACIKLYDERVYNWYDDEEEVTDVELCQFTGDQCFGNPYFCEDCIILQKRDCPSSGGSKPDA